MRLHRYQQSLGGCEAQLFNTSHAEESYQAPGFAYAVLASDLLRYLDLSFKKSICGWFVRDLAPAVIGGNHNLSKFESVTKAYLRGICGDHTLSYIFRKRFETAPGTTTTSPSSYEH